MIPNVTLEDAKGFSKVWTYKGLSIPLTEQAMQFAVDFSNIALRSFCNSIRAAEAINAPVKTLVEAE